MTEIQFLTTRRAIRQTADLAPLSPRHYPVRLGQTWTYRSVTRQVSGPAVDETVAIERERVAGVMPSVNGWDISVDHEIVHADKSREQFVTSLRVGESTVGEAEGAPFLMAAASWSRHLEDRTVVSFQATDGITVSVPAGVYTDCRLVQEIARRNGEVLYERQDWYAPGVGRVQSTYTRSSALGSYTEERHLIQAELG